MGDHYHILADRPFGGIVCVACGQRWSMRDLDNIIRELEAVKAREEAASDFANICYSHLDEACLNSPGVVNARNRWLAASEPPGEEGT